MTELDPEINEALLKLLGGGTPPRLEYKIDWNSVHVIVSFSLN